MEIDVAAAAEEIRNIGKADKGKGVDDFLSGVGLGAFADQLKDLRLSKFYCCALTEAMQVTSTVSRRVLVSTQSPNPKTHTMQLHVQHTVGFGLGALQCRPSTPTL